MYVLLRIGAAVPTVLGVTVFAFILVHAAPGDPLTALTEGKVSQQLLAELQRFYGLDLPLPEQYLHWLGNVVLGDLGVSFANGRAVAPELLSAFDASLKVLVLAAPLAVALGWVAGSIAAFENRTTIGRVLTVLLGCSVSIPSYWLGMLLVAIFAVTLGWLPAMGMGPTATWSGWFTAAGLAHVVLPVLTLIMAPAGILGRSTKTAIEAAMAEDFTEALRARGVSERYIRRRVARNALPGLIPLYGLQISYMASGLVLIEAIFAWPGIGNYLILAISSRDIPSIQAGILLMAVMFIAVNLAADLLQAGLDRRIRR